MEVGISINCSLSDSLCTGHLHVFILLLVLFNHLVNEYFLSLWYNFSQGMLSLPYMLDSCWPAYLPTAISPDPAIRMHAQLL